MAVTVSSRLLRALLGQATVNTQSLKVFGALVDKIDPEAKDENLVAVGKELMKANEDFLTEIATAIKQAEEEKNGG